jgi:hypothetical protein
MVAAGDERSIIRGKEGHQVGYLFRGAQTIEGVQRG